MFITVSEEFLWGALLILSSCRNFTAPCSCACEVVDLSLGTSEEETTAEEWSRFSEIETSELVLSPSEDCSQKRGG